MQFLTLQDSQRWLDERCDEAMALVKATSTAHACSYLEQAPAHVVRGVCGHALRWLLRGGGSRGVLLVRDFGVTPSREMPFLYSLLRRHYFNTQTVWESPGHLFESHELHAAEAVMFLALCFGWGFVAAVDGGPELVTADDDMHVRFLSQDPQSIAEMQRWLAGHGV